MNDLILLGVFYYEMRARGTSIHGLYLNVDDKMIDLLQDTYNIDVTIEDLEEAAKTCIACGWLERTTADPFYNFLSMTEKGLDRFIESEFAFQK